MPRSITPKAGNAPSIDSSGCEPVVRVGLLSGQCCLGPDLPTIALYQLRNQLTERASRWPLRQSGEQTQEDRCGLSVNVSGIQNERGCPEEPRT
jgi:hypothetical protein